MPSLLVGAKEHTVRSAGRTGKPSRQLRSDWTQAWEGTESPGALPMPLQSLISEPSLRRVDTLASKGDPGAQALATYWVGQGVRLLVIPSLRRASRSTCAGNSAQ